LQNALSTCPGGQIADTSIHFEQHPECTQKIEENAENIQMKCIYPQYAHWAYARNILWTCVDNIWNVLGGYISETWQGLILAVNKTLPMGTFGAYI
jgi:hypothetical protein